VIRESKSDVALARAVVCTQKYPSEQGGGGGLLRFLREEAEGRRVSVTS